MRGASKKVENGKLVNIELEASDTIQNVNIRGDFFIEPPQALDALESRLEGLSVDAERSEYMEALSMVDADLIGFDRDVLIDLVFEALGRN